MSLFVEEPAYQPLAARLRPRTLDEVVGQSHLLAPGKPLGLGQGGYDEECQDQYGEEALCHYDSLRMVSSGIPL